MFFLSECDSLCINSWGINRLQVILGPLNKDMVAFLSTLSISLTSLTVIFSFQVERVFIFFLEKVNIFLIILFSHSLKFGSQKSKIRSSHKLLVLRKNFL
ncbi:hypothetical protein A0128_14955 [Leptospira tipperaryensis]|uniref:Uncharacterized protein n=1 Tax=Leptospira tipperaryensis TaxID=2564040 RepID=A0A1D7UZN0_9LEPT|nr:hypothetical protein A0128_14955 [Leptospira tipperaryensis]